MKIYKFGGASVRSAEGVRNLKSIVEAESGPLVVIVSAMGKTTNLLERVNRRFMDGDLPEALDHIAECESHHVQICSDLFSDGAMPVAVKGLFAELRKTVGGATPAADDFELSYDRIVSFGEMISTSIISTYLEQVGLENKLLDMRRCFVTDGRHRDANVDIDASTPILRGEIEGSGKRLFVGQGFIGGTPAGEVTTLGREGSDYSAAVAANILDAQSLTIWKDVCGILNADPKIFSDTRHIPELTYLDAIELAYSGAQIIHPKTIKPLQNKDIPLYVKPFGDPTAQGSVIKAEITENIDVPILILRRDQILISIRPNDFSFVLEDRFAAVFALIERFGVKISLIQSSAVNLSITVDRTRRLGELAEELRRQGYRVVYNDDMEILTIRGYTQSMYEQYDRDEDVFLTQRTRKILRIVRKRSAEADAH